MIKSILLLIILSINTMGFGQIATFDWRMHVSFTNPNSIATDGNTVLCAFKNGILEYDIQSKETEIWSHANYLSDVEISKVFYDPASKAFWIGYINGNIDKFSNNTITNIPYLKLANIIGSKKINEFYAEDGKVFAVSDFGIMVIDPVKAEILDTYFTNSTNQNNLSMAILNDSIYAMTPHGIYVANKHNPILSDFAQWKLMPSTILTGDTASFMGIVKWKNKIFLGKSLPAYYGDSIFELNNGHLSSVFGQSFELRKMEVVDEKLYVNNLYEVVSFISDNSTTPLDYIYHYAFTNKFDPVSVVRISDGTYYIADNLAGLVEFTNNENSRKLSPSGPPDNQFYRITTQKDKLLFSGGIIVTGPNYKPAKVYSFQNEVWTDLSKEKQPEIDTIYKIWDMNGVAISPKDPNVMAISASGEDYTLFVIRDGKNISEKYGVSNSILEYALNNIDLTFTTDLKFDKKGNLWILNGKCNYPLKVLTKDGVFYKFNTGGSTRQKAVDHLVLDDNDNPWFAVDGVGIVGYFHNGTIEDVSDDSYKILNNGDFTGALPNNDVTDIAKTLDGKLFISTTKGFSILNNPSSVKDATYGNYNTFRPKIPFGENTEYVLGYTNISCVAVDGGNRKWVGTENSGIFCISEDGYSIVHEYNTENSHLISNKIIDLGFDETNGELFVITDLGLESIRVDASKGTDDYSNTIVFPNPVRPEFKGVVTIQGIKNNSDVKITDVAGQLVYKTTSNGGTATWNCKTVNGQDVATGVYLIWTAPNDAKGRKVGQVTVIR